VNRNLDSNSVQAHVHLEQAIHGNEPEAYASRVTKMAMKKIRLCVSRLVGNRSYSRQIEAVTDAIQIGSSMAGVSIPSGKIYEILKNISIDLYSPPIVDLDYFRFSMAKTFSPSRYSCVEYILPIGGFTTNIVVKKNRQPVRVYQKMVSETGSEAQYGSWV